MQSMKLGWGILRIHQGQLKANQSWNVQVTLIKKRPITRQDSIFTSSKEIKKWQQEDGRSSNERKLQREGEAERGLLLLGFVLKLEKK